ncbi:MAG: M48 family metalloprotease [Acidobacteria bacterium]|nr:M48 family metalloprotease [Acidobacteriota bacterium]
MKIVCSLVLVISFFSTFSSAQTCAPPQIVANKNTGNMFTPEQEMILGELTLNHIASDFRPIRSPELIAYVERIGNELLKHFPETGLKFTFHIIEYPQANAFNTPGGHVFLTRKLIALSASEDEVASVIAHELGHAAVRHGSQDISEAMKRVLNVTSVGDRRDIIDKYNRLIENARTKRSSARRGHENEQQLEADKLGFFAMVAAGYDPNASFTFFDRLTESDGKTGNWFGDLFGNTRPEQKRLREIAKSTERLPQECRAGRSATATDAFLSWQADVVRFRDVNREDIIPGLMWKRDLNPKIRSDVNIIKFSHDGKYLLAADDFAVSVIDREQGRSIFQAHAEDVIEAYFTNENKEVVFLTDNLRFERWNINDSDALEVRELVLRSDCWEQALSPDGKYLACIDQATNINIMDTKTGKRVFEKKKFYELTVFEYLTWLTRSRSENTEDVGFFRIGFSPDSKYVMFSRSNKHRFRIKIDGLTVDQSENTAFAVDTGTMKQINPRGSLKKIASRPYAFVDADKVLGNPEPKLDTGGIFSFPDGKRLTKVEFGAENVGRTANPKIVTIKPLQNASIGIYDVERSIIITGMDKNDIAVWEDLIAFESAGGKIVVRKLTIGADGQSDSGTDLATIDIPVGAMNNIRASEVSDDFNWAALSTSSRGGVWDLKTGERKIFTRGFLSGVVDGSGNSVAMFPKFRKEKPSLAFLQSSNGQAQLMGELPEHGVTQHGRFLLKRTSLAPEDNKQGSDGSSQTTDDEQAASRLRSNVKLEVFDIVKNANVWSRNFPKAVPGYAFDTHSGRLLLFWRLSSDSGKARLLENPALAAKAAALGDNQSNYMIDVVDNYEGRLVGNVFIDTGRGSFSLVTGRSERDWLALRDSEGRVLVYSIAGGDLKHRFFGTKVAINPTANQLVAETFPGDVALYSLDTGEKVNDFKLKGSLAFSRFSLDGKRLFLFSDQQTGYSIDLSKVPQIEQKGIF